MASSVRCGPSLGEVEYEKRACGGSVRGGTDRMQIPRREQGRLTSSVRDEGNMLAREKKRWRRWGRGREGGREREGSLLSGARKICIREHVFLPFTRGPTAGGGL